jgi:PAS domain S-box-containing protein
VSPIAIVYVVTAVVGVSLGFLLAYLARLSSQSAVKVDKKPRRMLSSNSNSSVSGTIQDTSLKQMVFESISDVVDSQQHCSEISERVSTIFHKELEKRIDLNTKELNKKYGAIIEEKTKSEEIAWKKYKHTLSDKKQTEAVIHSIAQGLVVVDAKGRVVMMNPAAEKLLDVSKKDKIGKPIMENLKEEQLVSLVKGAPDKGDKEIELISQQDETKKVLRASSAVIEDENGNTVGMVSVLSDITKQKELDRLKASFVANVSHELRTPLVAVDKSLSLILSGTAGNVSENQQQLLSIAQRNIKRLGLLINDLLDLSKLEAGKMQLKRESALIEEVINESVYSLDTWAKTKSIKIEKKIQEGLPEVYIDPNRIIQVLNNLIGNAIKFTPRGGNITISANLNEASREVLISVKDSGIGIAKEDLPKIFSKFYQVGERTTTDIGGTGIGLSIAKEIVELHGGRIWVESEKNKGTKFTFKLPLR